MLKRAAVLLSFIVFATGCGSSQVQVALNPARLEPCKFLSTKEVYDPLGPKSLIAEAKDVAAAAGGNTILVGKEESGFLTEKATIEIYSCPSLVPARETATKPVPARSATPSAMKEPVLVVSTEAEIKGCVFVDSIDPTIPCPQEYAAGAPCTAYRASAQGGDTVLAIGDGKVYFCGPSH